MSLMSNRNIRLRSFARVLGACHKRGRVSGESQDFRLLLGSGEARFLTLEFQCLFFEIL